MEQDGDIMKQSKQQVKEKKEWLQNRIRETKEKLKLYENEYNKLEEV